MTKGKVFDTVKFGPFEAKIRLSKAGMFSCDYGDECRRAGDLETVRKWAWNRLRDTSNLDWKPILGVTFEVEDQRINNLRTVSNLKCYIQRFYIAWDGAKWIQTPWVVMPPCTCLCLGPNRSDMKQEDHKMSDEDLVKQRIAESRICYWAPPSPTITFPQVNPDRMGDTEYYVPYNETTWQTMLGMLDKMRELRTRLADMLTTSAGWGQLAAMAGVKLLEAPKEDTHT
jgi:hypothetical protein